MTFIPFCVVFVAPKKSTMECKACRSIPVCIALCHAHIIYIHCTYLGMSRACIHLGVHNHHGLNGTCLDSLDMTYKCITQEVMKTPTTKNFAIVLAVSKQFLANYLLKFPSNNEGHHLASFSLEVLMDKFRIFISANCCNFVSSSKC